MKQLKHYLDSQIWVLNLKLNNRKHDFEKADVLTKLACFEACNNILRWRK